MGVMSVVNDNCRVVFVFHNQVDKQVHEGDLPAHNAHAAPLSLSEQAPSVPGPFLLVGEAAGVLGAQVCSSPSGQPHLC